VVVYFPPPTRKPTKTKKQKNKKIKIKLKMTEASSFLFFFSPGTKCLLTKDAAPID